MPPSSGQRLAARLWAFLAQVMRGLWDDALITRLVKNTGLLLGGRTSKALLTLGYLAIAARGLGIDDFGVLVLIHTFVQLVGTLVKFQAWHAVLTYGTPAWQQGRLGDLRRILWFTLRLDAAGAVVGSVIVIISASLAGRLLGWGAELVPSVQIYGLSILFMATATSMGILRLFDRFGFLAFHAAIAPLIQFVGALIAFWMDAPLEVYLAIWFAATAAAGVILAWRAWLEVRGRGVLSPDAAGAPAAWTATGTVWRFVWSTNFTSTLELSLTHFPTLLVGALAGPQAAALYRVARQLADAVAGPTKLVLPAIFPELARLVSEEDTSVLRQFVFRSTLLAGFFACVLVGLLALVGKWLLLLIAGADFTAAYGVMILLAAAAALRMWSLPFEPMLIASGGAHKVLVARTVTTFICLVLLFVLTSPASVIGAGIAVLVTRALNAGCFIALALPLMRVSRSPAP